VNALQRLIARHAATSEWVIAAICLVGITAGGVLHLAASPRAGDFAWAATAAVALVPLTWSVVATLLRRQVGVDAIALVAIVAALALQEFLAGALVALMLSGGNALEAYAAGRARRELRQLVERAPRHAHRLEGNTVVEVPVEEVGIGDVVIVRAGGVVPVDGVLLSAEAVLDESALTGESLPAVYSRGATLRSGTSNAAAAIQLRAIASASESAYAAVVRLVRQAETHRAPFVRIADRYAAAFLPVTLAAAGLAWGLSGEPERALAILVVATPCPLILAAPIAFIAGISRAARVGVIVKGGAAIEKLGEARTVLFDKTGTLTLGAPEVEAVVPLGSFGEDELLGLAASVDQLSSHVIGEALVKEAHLRGIGLLFPHDVNESPGRGIEGHVGDRHVVVGGADWLTENGCAGAEAWIRTLDGRADAGAAKVMLGVDGVLAGGIVVADRIRDDGAELVPRLREAGIRHIALVTGDREDVGAVVGERVGVDRIYAEQSPEDKLDVVRLMRESPGLAPVVMVGDGVNDAPALALADVGIAMGAAGASVASETADAVIVVDRIGRVVDAVRIGRRSLRIARQSVLIGIGLSLVAMTFAGFGYIEPVAGALIQEAIDVFVILNALRALRA
jgi:heavy metal translocating P-type ATPase